MRCGGRVAGTARRGSGEVQRRDGRQIRTTAQACDNIQRAEGSQCGAGPATDILTPGKSAASSRPGLPTPLGTASPISSLVNATMSENIAAAQQARVDGQIGQLPSQFGMHLLSLPRPLPPVTCRAQQRRYRVGCAGMFGLRIQYSPRWVVSWFMQLAQRRVRHIAYYCVVAALVPRVRTCAQGARGTCSAHAATTQVSAVDLACPAISGSAVAML